MDLKEIIKSKDTIIIDVRSVGEFIGGNVAASINIPLPEIPNKINELKSMNKIIVLCCLSGGRSEQATHYLKQQGLEKIYNGGSWMDVNYLKNSQN